jgi:hypothetical protein
MAQRDKGGSKKSSKTAAATKRIAATKKVAAAPKKAAPEKKAPPRAVAKPMPAKPAPIAAAKPAPAVMAAGAKPAAKPAKPVAAQGQALTAQQAEERRKAATRKLFARLRSLEAIVGADLRKRGSLLLSQAVDQWYAEAISATASDVTITTAARAVIAHL